MIGEFKGEFCFLSTKGYNTGDNPESGGNLMYKILIIEDDIGIAEAIQVQALG